MRAVIFDLFCTLVPGGSDAALAATRREMGKELGIDPEAFSASYHETWPARARGELGDLRQSIRTIARRADPHARPTDAQIEAAVAARLALLREWMAPTAQALSTLELLRAQGWRLGLLSNCGKETEELFPACALAMGCFDAVGLSSAMGFAKPQAQAYQRVAAMLGVQTHECVFVGDGAGDELPGAAAVGARAVQVTEFATVDNPPPVWPGEVIFSVAQVPVLIGFPAGRDDPEPDRPLATIG